MIATILFVRKTKWTISHIYVTFLLFVFLQELEQIEDNWRQESQDLVKMTNKLQEENRNLKVLIRDQKETAVIKAAELTKSTVRKLFLRE